jgi:predicted enzyme related to lactoylglutathione lyase
MAERTHHPPGAFCWTDLTTTDQEGAKAFYGGLFGWEAEDMPTPGGGFYSMMRLGGRDVASIVPQPPPLRDAGAPPTWNSYVSVESADRTAERATELGAELVIPTGDVADAGRLAAIRDPQGAFFMVWQPGEHFGAALVNAPGALVWNELASSNLDASAGFYRELFGWTIEPVEGSPESYLRIKNGEANNGGIRPVTPPGTPPHWLVYFATDDVDAAVATVEELGGARLAGPLEISMGKIAIVRDPQGAAFALYVGHLEP